MLHLEKIVFQAFSYEYITQLDENVDVKTLFINIFILFFIYTIEVDSYQFEYEQNIVAEMLFIFKANDPFKLQELLDTFVLIISY